ncbi:outer membrane beta-barrel protein [Croceitalea marina]|uniref:Outer membrane beta-barrel protein n=1 Tax=Croceitalea marina TaxID=1775166 RepID=A0ABW5MYH2_9FLAO
MRKVLLITLLVTGFAFNANAQDSRFGATVGFLNAGGKVTFEDESVTGSDAGFYLGLIGDFGVTEKFHIQPELLYASVDGSSAIFIPVLAKIYVAEGFNLQAGPEISFSLEETGDDISSLSTSIAAGLGYDITEDFFVEARYSQQLNNSYTGDLDITARGNGLFVGLGYKF